MSFCRIPSLFTSCFLMRSEGVVSKLELAPFPGGKNIDDTITVVTVIK